jgi:AP-2 complex subunit alpha
VLPPWVCCLQVGYIVTAALLNETVQELRLVINTVRNDIISRNEIFQCLGLTFVSALA